MSEAERPPPDPSRLLAAIDAWAAGDNTPGTTMQSLKRGGMDQYLAQLGDEGDDARDAWERWEKGRATPGETLRALEEARVRELLSRS